MGKLVLPIRDGWQLKSTSQVMAEGDLISTGAFQPEDWFPTTVPSTVLAALVRNGVYPDPRLGLNNLLIPDASDEFNQQHDLAQYSYLPDGRNPWKDPYWYRVVFELPADWAARQWLCFQAINYRADVWLNGQQIADAREMVGAFRRFRYEVTDWLRPGEANYLAVKIYGLDHPGVPGTQLQVFQRPRTSKDGAQEETMRDMTFTLASVGYDCAPAVRDRLMGIWQEVYLEGTGLVDIRDPFVKTELPLPATSPARLTLSAELVNASDAPQEALLRGTIDGDRVVEQRVRLAPREAREVHFLPEDYPPLVVEQPRLWWPVNCGEQNLYTLTLRCEVEGAVSDEESTPFGIRQVTKVLHEVDGEYGLQVHVNGRRVFGRGGYLQFDTLLAPEWMNAQRFEAEIRYLASANLNTISFEDIPNLPDAFYDLCDRYGVMFWNCFFQCWWLISDDHPLDHDLLEACAADIVKRYRNHPSIVAYMCMNEATPAEDQYRRWRRQVVGLDGTRILVPSGYFNPNDRTYVPEWIQPDAPVGANDYPPKSYTWQSPDWYYRMVRTDGSWMFKIESGSASLPPLESLEKFIPDLGNGSPDAPYPLDSAWAHHGANAYYRDYDAALRRRYGPPVDVADYCWKGHLTTANQHRAMFDAVNHRLWERTSGFMQWKLNSCWPSVQWQIYDYFLRPMVSYYAIKKACAPLYVQLSPLDNLVTVINNTWEPRHLQAQASVYDFQMRRLWEQSLALEVAADSYQDAFRLPPLEGLAPVYFVRLDLTDAEGRSVADNFYWLYPPDRPDDTACYVALRDLPCVQVEATGAYQKGGAEDVLRARVTNPSPHLAFFVHLQAVREANGEELLPVWWEDNYFSLLPGESREVTARFGAGLAGADGPVLVVDGWNIERATHRL